MKLVLLGCTGFVGKHLMARLQSAGHHLIAVVRRPGSAAPWAAEELPWNADWGPVLGQCDGIVNLAGASIAQGRWTAPRRQDLFDSRILVTRRIAASLSTQKQRPFIWVNASAVGYYGDRGNEILGEDSGPGEGFLATLGRAWEAESQAAHDTLGVPVVQARLGVVLGPGGGLLGRVQPLFRWGLGGKLGSGSQWMSWIHLTDAVAALEFSLAGGLLGPLNICSPQPVTNAQFTRTLAASLGRPAFLPAPAWGLRLALGEMSSLLLDSQRAVPRRLQAAGFRFHFGELHAALEDLRPQ